MTKIVFAIATIILLVLVFIFIPSVSNFFNVVFEQIGRLNTSFFSEMPGWFGFMIFSVFFGSILTFIWNFKN